MIAGLLHAKTHLQRLQGTFLSNQHGLWLRLKVSRGVERELTEVDNFSCRLGCQFGW
jgi:hypothetical protein